MNGCQDAPQQIPAATFFGASLAYAELKRHLLFSHLSCGPLACAMWGDEGVGPRRACPWRWEGVPAMGSGPSQGPLLQLMGLATFDHIGSNSKPAFSDKSHSC